jgi:hypothetical protein
MKNEVPHVVKRCSITYLKTPIFSDTAPIASNLTDVVCFQMSKIIYSKLK